jgi:hypothetical protein
MKRPRFGLKLIFLITALVAVLMAWRHVADQNERAANEERAKPIRQQLAAVEAHREKIIERIKQLGRQPERGISPALDMDDEEIEILKGRIDRLTR